MGLLGGAGRAELIHGSVGAFLGAGSGFECAFCIDAHGTIVRDGSSSTVMCVCVLRCGLVVDDVARARNMARNITMCL